MTFGEKLKQARLQAGLSQEQLAEKLNVSRSAIAKWETDKGLPDVENLKSIARFLDVSIDYLLADDEVVSFATTKEPINLGDYAKNKKRHSRKDAVVVAKYPTATSICPLFREKKLSKVENILEWTIMPAFGIFDFVHQVNDLADYYLVEMNEKHYLVSVSKEFITSTQLMKKMTEKKFTIGKNKFTKMNCELVE